MCVTTIDIFIFDKVLIKLTSLPPLDFLAKILKFQAVKLTFTFIPITFWRSGVQTKGYDEKIQKALYLGPYAFLSKNKGTFEWQTFYFLSESIFVFFIFGQKRPKIAVLIFNCLLYGILFHSKSLPYKNVLRNAEKFKRGGAHWALESREVILKSQIWKV